jgi:hypothetical protein
MGAITGRFQCLLWLALAMVCATLQGLPQNAADAHLPEGFPYSAWLEQKEITQIGWNVVVGKPALRSDLRQEIEIWAMIARQDARKTEDHDLVMYARVLDGGRALGPVHMVEPVENRVPPELQPKGPPPPKGFRIIALVKPGKYRLELALLDRTNGRYSTKFESVVVEGLKTDALAESFDKFSKFEFVPLRKREDTAAIDLPPGPDFSFGPGGFSGTLYVRRKNFVGLPASSSGVTEGPADFRYSKTRHAPFDHCHVDAARRRGWR